MSPPATGMVDLYRSAPLPLRMGGTALFWGLLFALVGVVVPGSAMGRRFVWGLGLGGAVAAGAEVGKASRTR